MAGAFVLAVEAVWDRGGTFRNAVPRSSGGTAQTSYSLDHCNFYFTITLSYLRPSLSTSYEFLRIVRASSLPFGWEIFSVYFKAARLWRLSSAPFVLWQVWRFIAPGFINTKEVCRPFLIEPPSFIAGALRHLISPALTLKMIAGMAEPIVKVQMSALSYFDLLSMIVIAMGIVFGSPVIFVLANRPRQCALRKFPICFPSRSLGRPGDSIHRHGSDDPCSASVALYVIDIVVARLWQTPEAGLI
jgi:hypothetical protein